MILAKLKADAEVRLGEKITQAVTTRLISTIHNAGHQRRRARHKCCASTANAASWLMADKKK
jgi:hypothetical protein